MKALLQASAPSYAFHDLKPAPDDFRADLIAGLSLRQKTIPSKFF